MPITKCSLAAPAEKQKAEAIKKEQERITKEREKLFRQQAILGGRYAT